MREPVNKSIILCGFMASGKSSIGKRLAERLQLPFTDTDEYIVRKAGRSIPEIFAAGGEALFRDLEHDCAKSLIQQEPQVISTGGGMLTFARNISLLKDKGIIIWLDRDFEEMYRIIRKDPNRPLGSKSKEELLDLYRARSLWYREAAHFKVRNEGSMQDCVQKICRLPGLPRNKD